MHLQNWEKSLYKWTCAVEACVVQLYTPCDLVKQNLNLSHQGHWSLNWASLTPSSLPELSREYQTQIVLGDQFSDLHLPIVNFLNHVLRKCPFLSQKKKLYLSASSILL